MPDANGRSTPQPRLTSCAWCCADVYAYRETMCPYCRHELERQPGAVATAFGSVALDRLDGVQRSHGSTRSVV